MKRPFSPILITLLLLLATVPAGHLRAQAQSADSIATGDPTTTFSPRQLIIPAALITAGSWGVCNGWYVHVKHGLKSDMARLRGDHYLRFDDQLQYLPAVANVALAFTELESRHTLRERLALTATASAAMAIMVNGVKHTVREKRPDSSRRNSFPSGHTATAFMGAELVRADYGTVPGIAAYSVATLVAAMRLYNERHWLNDVLAGAGVGILAARTAYWLLPVERRLLGWKEQSAAVVVMPTYQPGTRTLGFSMAMGF